MNTKKIPVINGVDGTNFPVGILELEEHIFDSLDPELYILSFTYTKNVDTKAKEIFCVNICPIGSAVVRY